MNLRHLRTFVTIAETGSFQAAAERLFLTQSAVSMQMKALEETLQAELFDRGKRPPVLSAHGRALLDRARDLVDQVENFRRAAAGGDELLGSLTLGRHSLAQRRPFLPGPWPGCGTNIRVCRFGSKGDCLPGWKTSLREG